MYKPYWNRWTPIRYLFVESEGADDGAGGEGIEGDDAKDDTEVSMSSAIDAAAKEIEDELRTEDKDDAKDDDAKDDAKDDETDDEDEDDKKELSEEELVHAKNLFKLLNNKDTALGTLRTLVSSAGLELKDIETKKEQSKAVKTVKERIKEKLGDEYKFLGDKLGDAIETVLAEEIDSRTKDIRERQKANENETRLNAIKDAQIQVSSEYKEIPTKVLEEVLRIQTAEELLPGKASPAKFFKSCLIMAADNLNVTLEKKSAQGTKSTKPKSPLQKLQDSGQGSQKEGVRTSQVKTINDAIEKAAADFELQKK